MTAATDLVPVNTELAEAEVARVAAAITELGVRNDAEALKNVAGEIDARVVYFRRQGLNDAIRRGFRLRCLAEAELGEILLRDEWDPALQIDTHDRTIWRALAVGRRRGVFESVVAEAAEAERWTADDVYRRLRLRGIQFVPAGCLRKAIAECGMTKRELELRAGVTHRTVLSLAGEVREENRRQASVRWDCAVRVAEVLGVESTTLPLARRRPRKSRRRLWLRRQRKLTGGRWDEAYVRFRHALDEFARCAGEDVSWDDAYAHWYEIEKTLVAAMRRDERYAP